MSVFFLRPGTRALASLALLASLTATHASAGDFTGAHLGVLLGYERGSAEVGDIAPEITGAIIGAEVGANYQFDSGLVLGVALDAAYSTSSGHVMDGKYMRFEGEGEASVQLLGRIGYAVDSVLPYLTAGVGYLKSTSTMICAASATNGDCKYFPLGFETSSTVERVGYVVGAGLEVALNESVSLKAEYLYADYGTEPLTLHLPESTELTNDVKMSASTVRTGLLFRF